MLKMLRILAEGHRSDIAASFGVCLGIKGYHDEYEKLFDGIGSGSSFVKHVSVKQLARNISTEPTGTERFAKCR